MIMFMDRDAGIRQLLMKGTSIICTMAICITRMKATLMSTLWR